MVDPVPTPADPVVPVQPPIPVSPTGLAWIPANITKIIGLVIAIALAVLVVLMKAYPNVPGFALAFAIVTAIGALFGIASPGLRTTTLKMFIVAIGLGMVMSLSSCAAISWQQPVFYAGPAVGPIEEVSSAHPSPALAAGWQESVGFGQYEMGSREWDLFEVGLLELGGVVPSGSPVGQLQLGGKIGTLNGLIGFGVLFDCVDSASHGACQGGRPGGPIFAGILDVQALIAYFGSIQPNTTQHLKRGGLLF